MVVQRPHANASYGQMGVRLIDRLVSNPFPLVTSTKSLSVVPQNTGGWTQEAHSHCWAWMGRILVWGSFHPGAILLQVEGMVARKLFSPLLYFRDNIASQYTVIISAI